MSQQRQASIEDASASRRLDRPPTTAEARQWYQNGWIDDDGLEELIENAMQEYGGDGNRQYATRTTGDESRFKLLGGDRVQAGLLDEVFKALFWIFVGVMFYELALAATQPPPGAIPPI